MNIREIYLHTPLILSVSRGRIGIVKLLLEHGADVHALNGEGQTPYQLSLQKGYREIANLLLEHGADEARFGIFLRLLIDI